jgi:hypothetical protein
MVGDFYRLYTESVGDLGYIPYIPYIPNSPTGGHSGRKTSHGGRIRYIYIVCNIYCWNITSDILNSALVYA